MRICGDGRVQSDLRSVTSQEVVASLLRSKLTYRGKHTEGIAGQHDNVRRLAVNDARNLSVGDIFNGVCATGILRDADVVVVGSAVQWVVDNVLKDAAVLDGVENIGFLLSGQVDAFGVASTFDVEDTRVRPDMLIVSDEQTVGVGRKGGLSGTRKTEEESDIALLDADVGGGVQRELAEFDGLQVMLKIGES